MKNKEAPQGDLISRSALKEDFKSRLADCNDWIENAKDKETKIRASAVKTFIAEVILTINNAPTVEYPFYQEAYQTGYEEGKNERQKGEPVIKCQDCKYQVKEWREDKRMKEKGYWVYGCEHFGDIMGYWGFGGNDNEFCSDAEQK